MARSIDLTSGDEVGIASGGGVLVDDLVSGTPRIWANFTGTGTATLDDSYNVDSLTDNSTGNYTINFSITMDNATYAVIWNSDPAIFAGLTTESTTSAQTQVYSHAGVLTDSGTMTMIISGDKI